MKKTRTIISQSIFLLILCCFMYSCDKESINDNEIEENNLKIFNETFNVNSLDGMLEFESFEAFNFTINTFSDMNEDERIAWGKENNFESQQIILDKISKAEDEFDDSYFKGIDEDLNTDQLSRVNKPIAFSGLYNHYLKLGFIKQVIEKDGSYSYSINVNEEPSAFVCNEEGFVMIAGIVHRYSTKGLEFDVYNKSNNTRKTASKEEKSAHKPPGLNDFYIDNIFAIQGTIANKTWYYDSAKLRFYHFVRLVTCELTTHKMSSLFSTVSKAERKRWGKWKVRNSYTPIKQISGSWDYSWDYWYPLGGTGTHTNALSLYCTNSVYWGPSLSNFRGGYLCPSGTITSDYQIADPLRIHNMHIQGIFVGDTGNYQTNYTN